MRKLFEFLRAIDPLVHLAFLIAIFVLGYGYFSLSGQLGGISSGLNELRDKVASITPPAPVVTNKEKEDLSSSVPSPTPTSTPKGSVVSAPSKKSTTYIAIGSSLTTTSSDWVDVGGDVYIDLKNEYGENAYVDWEANIKISGNGKVYTRLYDVTHSIAVNSSELSSSSTTSTRVSSPRLYLWAGHNLYRVQIKSTAPYTAAFDSGRIKIVY